MTTTPTTTSTTKTEEKRVVPPMEYRHLGNSGLKVSAISLGAWMTWGKTLSNDEAYKCMKEAFDLGCNFFDNAEVYAAGDAEKVMGNIIKQMDVDRSELVISTKIFWGGSGPNQRGLSRKHILEGMGKSLKRLQLEYADVVFAHRPDPSTPVEEVVRAFNHLIEKGSTLYWGVSEWSATQIEQAWAVADKLGLIGPIAEQPQYSMLHRSRVEVEYEPLYKNRGLGTTIWSPLASGLLSGKYTSTSFGSDTRLGSAAFSTFTQKLVDGEGLNGLEEKDVSSIFKKVSGLNPIAKKLECSIPQLALAWTLINPNVSTCITGASKKEQVTENFGALAVYKALKKDEKLQAEIETILANKPKAPRDWRA
jgi:voltage-dependent potassium channel beta subunit